MSAASTPAEPRYDRIGRVYAEHRRPDPRWARRIEASLEGARSVVNVGAGTGSYEPPDRNVIAVEPSPVMVAQRPDGSSPVVRGIAEALPFRDGEFDAALAILTIHHWSDKDAGLRELCRVAPRRVVLTFDIAFEHHFWLVAEYLPEIAELDYGDAVPVDEVAEKLGGARVDILPLPHDFADGVLCAHWRRPERYLDPSVRACISGIARLDDGIVLPAMQRLEDDLRSGRWAARHRDLLERDEMDYGYRLVTAG